MNDHGRATSAPTYLQFLLENCYRRVGGDEF
jgi:hypothetical protein